MICIVGPTASGKTQLASALAAELDGEIISCDSRQVFRGMDIGTGKDLKDYHYKDKHIPYHLIDILPAGAKYSVFDYQKDFWEVYPQILSRGKKAILCGGTGLYTEAVTKGYSMPEVPINNLLRKKLSDKNLNELADILRQYRPLHNNTDIDTCKRAIRAIEIELYRKSHAAEWVEYPPIPSLYIGVYCERELRRQRITQRLHQRLEEGMIEEVKTLLDSGIQAEDLIFYGLEYKFITLYLIGKLDYANMVEQLNVAIHQFAKRQMTWYRSIERKGTPIAWIDGTLPLEERLKIALQIVRKANKAII